MCALTDGLLVGRRVSDWSAMNSVSCRADLLVRRQARRANAELMNERRGEQSVLAIKQRRALENKFNRGQIQ